MKLLNITLYLSNRISTTNDSNRVSMDWNEFVQTYGNLNNWQHFDAATIEQYQNAKNHFAGFVWSELRDGKRIASNVLNHAALVLDIDDGATFDEVRADLKEFEYFLYSTGSTGIKSGDRFRVVLPFENPVPAEVWDNYNASFKTRFPYSDECAFKSIQLMYVPSVNTAYKDQFIAEHHEGKFISLDDIQYVENDFMDGIYENIVLELRDFSSESVERIAKAIIAKNEHSYDYNQRRLLAQTLLAIPGFSHFDIMQVLNGVTAYGASKSNDEVLKGAVINYNKGYGHAQGVYKHLPAGFIVPELEQAKVAQNGVQSVSEHEYDTELELAPYQFLSHVESELDFNHKLILLIADVGTGKTYFFKNRPDTIFVAPLRSIVDGIGKNDVIGGNVGTWNQIDKILKCEHPEQYRDKTLVIDECHGLLRDVNYKSKTIRKLYKAFGLFKNVIMMSGTVNADEFHFKFDRVYRVHKKTSHKQVKTYFCKDPMSEVLEYVKNCTGKTIVLLNDKNKISVLEKALENPGGVRCITSDNSKDQINQEFFKSGVMSFDVLIGTNSILEGLSITDELDSANIVLVDEYDPNNVEQFANRFRNVSNKNVALFYTRMKHSVLPEFDYDNSVQTISEICDCLNKLYEVNPDCQYWQTMANTHKNLAIPDRIVFEDNKFIVDNVGLDSDAYDYRVEYYKRNFLDFAFALQHLDFEVLAPAFINKVDETSAVLKTVEAAVKAENEIRRCDILMDVSADFQNGCEHSIYSSTSLYKETYQALDDMDKLGLDHDSVPDVCNGLVNDEHFIEKCYRDYENKKDGNHLMNLLIMEINGRDKITSTEMNRIALSIAHRAAQDLGGIEALCKLNAWKSNVEIKDGVLRIKQNRAKALLSQFITIGDGVQKKSKGKQYREYPVLRMSLTGVNWL
ncbi:DEAD/DEAH box helicase family protein [Edwardsiella tarda]|uniref:DEAD/DEAH box helicase family protein n=1 Tax=Edwardsiella tarda TaxID=636 RepID=UPI00351CA9E0